MKTNTYILLLLAFFITGCTDLKNDSYGKVVSERYNPQTEEEISYLINAAYVPWREAMLLWNGVVRAQELCADQDVIPARPNGWVDGGVYKRWHLHTWTTDDDSVSPPWSYSYTGVNTCNRLLSQIEDGKITLSDEKRKDLIAELKVLRASYYYLLIDLYGNVPIVTDFKDESLPEQKSRKEVFKFIVDEINDNIESLSEEARGYYYGRFNKWAAYTLLAKMYINSEVWTEKAMWNECIKVCNKIINYAESTGEYILEENQKDIFKTNNEASKEIIYALPFDELYVTDWNAFDFHMYTLAPESQQTYNLQYVPWGGVCVIPQFIESFDSDDLRLKENFIQGQQYTASGNILLRSDNKKPLIYLKDVPSIDKSDLADGFRWGKFEYKMGALNRLSNDFPVFRYADVLFMKAECLLRLDQPGAGKLVSKIRARSFIEQPNKAIVSDEDLKEGSVYNYGLRNENQQTYEGGDDIVYGRLLDELGWEFNQEGRRRQDMIRFGVFSEKSWFSHQATNNKNLNVYPIPNSAMLTNSKLKQNIGYE